MPASKTTASGDSLKTTRRRSCRRHFDSFEVIPWRLRRVAHARRLLRMLPDSEIRFWLNAMGGNRSSKKGGDPPLVFRKRSLGSYGTDMVPWPRVSARVALGQRTDRTATARNAKRPDPRCESVQVYVYINLSWTQFLSLATLLPKEETTDGSVRDPPVCNRN
jgi:hypothetical protein